MPTILSFAELGFTIRRVPQPDQAAPDSGSQTQPAAESGPTAIHSANELRLAGECAALRSQLHRREFSLDLARTTVTALSALLQKANDQLAAQSAELTELRARNTDLHLGNAALLKALHRAQTHS